MGSCRSLEIFYLISLIAGNMNLISSLQCYAFSNCHSDSIFYILLLPMRIISFKTKKATKYASLHCLFRLPNYYPQHFLTLQHHFNFISKALKKIRRNRYNVNAKYYIFRLTFEDKSFFQQFLWKYPVIVTIFINRFLPNILNLQPLLGIWANKSKILATFNFPVILSGVQVQNCKTQTMKSVKSRHWNNSINLSLVLDDYSYIICIPYHSSPLRGDIEP